MFASLLEIESESVTLPRTSAVLSISLVVDVNDDEFEPSPPSLQEVKNTPPLTLLYTLTVTALS